MNRMTVAGVAALMVLASSAQVLASMSLSSQQPVETACPTTGSTAGTNGKDNIDSSAGASGLASAATTAAILPVAATATIPSSATSALAPSGMTTVTIPSGESSATTTGTSRATNAASATTGPYERRRTQQVERWDELSQRIGELARRKGLQRAADESAGSRKRGLERIERFLDIAQKMKPGVLARYR